ncbi:MAG: DUF438 domain-containing protein [Thermoleophilia bacterium]|nr:DUF438 domain-containing protein [Thermoleophilia bacterium]
MTITPKTTVHTLLKEHRFLLDFLADYTPEFKKLTSPVARRTMARMATLQTAAQLGDVPLDQLMHDVAAEIEAQTGVRPEVSDITRAADIDPARLAELKAIVTALHEGSTVEEVRPRFEELITDIEASEIAAMEQELIAGGVPEDEVKRLCDVHVEVFADALDGHEAVTAPPGHPVDTFQRENRALLQVTATLRKVAGAIGEPPVEQEWRRLKSALGETLERLLEVDLHYLRKENQLFPFLERHGIEGPSKVMWALHDDVRDLLKQARSALQEDEASLAVSTAQAVATMADAMVDKEEKILYPMAMDQISEDEWAAIRAGEAEIGYAFVGEVPAWPEGSAEALATPEPATTSHGGAGGLLELKTGALTLDQLGRMLLALPIDFSFVDEDDRVRFYSEGERIFPRSPGVIGRRVQNCHPPASVDKVQQIIDAFRAGEKDTADFWLQLGERFVHIRYFAVRAEGGAYRGVVEMVQDVTEIRALEGERRLLDW